MRNPLNKRIPRDLLQNWAKYLGVMIILITTIIVGSAFQSTIAGSIKFLDDIKDGNMLEDGYFEMFSPLSAETLSKIEEDNQLKAYENFYATENDYGDSTKIVIFNDRKLIDTAILFDGKMPEGEDEIALTHVFARVNNINVGDKIKVLGKEYKVSAWITLPDYTSPFMNNTDMVMNSKHFGIATLSEEGFKQIDAKKLTYRYSYRYDDRDLSDKDKTDKLLKMQMFLMTCLEGLQSVLSAEENQSISFLAMDIGKDGPMMVVFVYILIMVIAFIFAIMTSNNIEKESVIIGTLRASGYSKGEIIWHYLQPTIIIAIVGSIIGNFIGYTFMIEPFLGIYFTSYCIGPIDVQFNIGAFLMTTVLPVAIMILINYYMLARKLSLNPLKFLRKDLKKGKQKRAIKLPNFKFLNRFRIRVILQNKASYFMLFIGVFFSSFLLMFGIGLDPLMNHYTDTIDDSINYEYQYILKAPVETSEGEKSLLYEMDTWFKLGNKDIGVQIFGLDENSQYFDGAISKATIDEGVSISEVLAKKMNLKKGDKLHLKDKNRGKEYDFKVADTFDYSAGLAMFVPRAELAKLLELDGNYFNCITSEKKLDIDEMYVARQVTRDDLTGAASQMMQSFSTLIFYINIFSVVVYMVFMYILTKVVIDKNAICISYMKVFGYKPKEIRKLYLTATSIVVIVSLVICIPIEIALFKAVLVVLSSMIEGYLEFYLPNYVYGEIIVIGIVAYFVINAVHVAGINKIPMTDALKTRE